MMIKRFRALSGLRARSAANGSAATLEEATGIMQLMENGA